MKRATLLIIAALLVLLSYPSTHPLADTATKQFRTDKAAVITPEKIVNPPIANSGDDGDADDITGIRGGRGIHGDGEAFAFTGKRALVRMWWNFMLWFR